MKSKFILLNLQSYIDDDEQHTREVVTDDQRDGNPPSVEMTSSEVIPSSSAESYSFKHKTVATVSIVYNYIDKELFQNILSVPSKLIIKLYHGNYLSTHSNLINIL